MPAGDRGIIGREKERGQLLRLLARASEGHGGACVLIGESGVGKTRLVDEVVGGFEGEVVRVRCLAESADAYRTIHDLLKNLRRGDRKRSPRLERAVLWLDPLVESSPDDGLSASAVRQLLTGAFREVGERGSCLLVIDDLHHADETSLELIPHLLEELGHLPLMFLLVCQADALTGTHPARRLMARLRRDPGVTEMSLGGLSNEETGRLLAARLGGEPDRALVRFVSRQASGLPLFIEELARSLEEGRHVRKASDRIHLGESREIPVPDSIRDAVALQRDSLGEASREALDLAAVFGLEFSFESLVAMGAGEEALDELLSRGFLVETNRGRGGFRHSLTREAILEEMPWSKRRRLHGEVARFLSPGERNRRLVGEHFREAGMREEARLEFLKEAERACGVHAFPEAARAFEQALELWPANEAEEVRLDCLERLADCAEASGYHREAIRALRDLLAAEAVSGDPSRRARVCRRLASASEIVGLEAPAVEAREQALLGFQEAGEWREAAREALGLADSLVIRCRLSEAKTRAEEALALAVRACDRELESFSLTSLGLSLAMMGKPVPARRKIEAGLELALRQQLKEAAASAYKQLAYVHAYQGDYAGQRDSFGAAVRFCQGEGLDSEKFSCLGCMAYALFRMGEWKRSAEVCREVLSSEKATEDSRIAAEAGLGLIFLLRGQVRQAAKFLATADEATRRLGITPLELILRPALGLLEQYRDASGGAEHHYREFFRLWEGTDDRFDGLFGFCLAASFFREGDCPEEVRRCVAAVQRMAGENRNPEALGSLAHVLGELAILEERTGDAVEQFLRSGEHFARMEARFDVARAHERSGVALLGSGSRSAGLEQLQKGYAEAKALGARRLQQVIRDRIEEAGGAAEEPRSVDSEERKTRAGLTRRQREVASLIAEGMTNKEIAQRLHLSPRTVDMHVSHLLDRLDCSTRSEAVRRLVDLGLID